MTPKNETHPGDYQAKLATTTAGRTSTGIEAAKPSTGNPVSAIRCPYTDRAEREGGSYSLQRWLQQDPKDGPWTATSSFAGQRHEGNGDKQNGTGN